MFESFARMPIGTLRTPRWHHGAVVLEDGRVLVFGGAGADGRPLRSTEIYDPKTKKWTDGPPMQNARESPAYSTFPGGVLVAGGYGWEGGKRVPLKTGERFDEDTSDWRATHPMPTARVESAAARLKDGTVLMAGGIDGTAPAYPSVMRYDPPVDRWHTEPSLPKARRGLSLAALPSGMVIAIGGVDEKSQPVLDINFFQQGYQWGKGPQLNAPRIGHATAVMPTGLVYVVGGESPGGPMNSAELIDMDRVWCTLSESSMARARQHGLAVPVGDNVALLLGGSSEDDTLESRRVEQAPLPAAPAAKPAPKQNWSYGDRLPRPMANMQAAVVNGKLIALVAKSEDHPAELWIYDPAARSWRQGAAPPDGRQGSATAVLGRKVYYIGGWYDYKTLETVMVYDASADRWSYAAPMHEGRSGAAASTFAGRIYVIGGSMQNAIPVSENAVYDPRTDSWSLLRPLPAPRDTPSAVAAYGKIYVFGGMGPTKASFWNIYAKDAWSYDPVRDTWQDLPPLPTPRAWSTAVLVDRKVYLVGGKSYENDDVSRFYSPTRTIVYDPASRVYAEGATLNEPREGAAIAAVGGTLYAAGGGPDKKASVEAWTPGQREAVDWLARFKKRAAPRPNDLAVIVGVADYKSLPRADYADLDARAYAAAVRALGVPEENVVTLVGDRAALSDVGKYVEEWLPKKAKPDSRVYFVFSGHGAPDVSDSSPYLMPWDADAAFVRSTGYSLSRLYESLAKLPAGEVVAVLDSCFSGAGGRSVLASGVRPLVHVAAPKTASGKLTIFAAAEGSETAGAFKSQSQGLFSYYLLEGLTGAADADGDGHITAQELHAYARRKVAVEARAEGREQTPTLIAPNPGLLLY